MNTNVPLLSANDSTPFSKIKLSDRGRLSCFICKKSDDVWADIARALDFEPQEIINGLPSGSTVRDRVDALLRKVSDKGLTVGYVRSVVLSFVSEAVDLFPKPQETVSIIKQTIQIPNKPIEEKPIDVNSKEDVFPRIQDNIPFNTFLDRPKREEFIIKIAGQWETLAAYLNYDDFEIRTSLHKASTSQECAKRLIEIAERDRVSCKSMCNALKKSQMGAFTSYFV